MPPPRRRSSALCAGALAALQLLALLAPAAAAIPPMPSWAKGPYNVGQNSWKDYSVRQGIQNRDNMAAANKAGKTYDFLLYGDSITQLIFRNGKSQWAAAFPNSTWVSAPYGVTGNDLQDLAWRLMGGWERPARAPRVVALLIGTNNVSGKTPLATMEKYLDYILGWWAAAYPSTRVVLMALLPSAEYSVAAANVRWRQVAARRKVTFKDCGGVIDPNDSRILYDGTHPTPAAMQLLLQCLAPTVGSLAGKPVYGKARLLRRGAA